MSDAMREMRFGLPCGGRTDGLVQPGVDQVHAQEEHDNGSKPQGGQNEECPFGAGRKSV